MIGDTIPTAMKQTLMRLILLLVSCAVLALAASKLHAYIGIEGLFLFGLTVLGTLAFVIVVNVPFGREGDTAAA